MHQNRKLLGKQPGTEAVGQSAEQELLTLPLWRLQACRATDARRRSSWAREPRPSLGNAATFLAHATTTLSATPRVKTSGQECPSCARQRIKREALSVRSHPLRCPMDRASQYVPIKEARRLWCARPSQPGMLHCHSSLPQMTMQPATRQYVTFGGHRPNALVLHCVGRVDRDGRADRAQRPERGRWERSVRKVPQSLQRCGKACVGVCGSWPWRAPVVKNRTGARPVQPKKQRMGELAVGKVGDARA